MTQALSICFVALRAYPVLASSIGHDFIGGAEVQQTLLAKALARNGHRVSLISFDFGQPRQCTIDGVNVHSIGRPGAGLPVLKLAHPFITGLWSAIKAADPAVLYQRSASRLTGIVSAIARAGGRAFVYAGAHDSDFMPGQELVPHRRDRLAYQYGLRRADTVIVQSPSQSNLLERAYGIRSELIGSCHPRPSGCDTLKDIDALWVGTFRSWKRPELFVELAKAHPTKLFFMVGGAAGDEPALYDHAVKAAEQVENLTLTGFVPYAQAERYFQRTKV